MGKKVIVVTGANKGIGLAIVETLLQQLPEACVLLGSRDSSRGWSAFFIFHRRFICKMENGKTIYCPFPSLLYLPGSGRGQAAVDSVVGKLGSGVEGRVKLLLLDVTSQESVDQAFETVRTEHGTIYGVSNRCHFISM